MTANKKSSNTTRRSFIQTLSGGLVAGPSLLNASAEKQLIEKIEGVSTPRLDINIPQAELERIIQSLCDFTDMQTSNYMADYDDEDLEMASLYRDEARSVRTVLDVVRFITSLGQDHLIDYHDTIDYAGQFEIRNPENLGEIIPDYDIQEKLFRDYLNKTYGIDQEEFPLS